VPDPVFSKGGWAGIERRRREDRGAEGVGCGEGVSNPPLEVESGGLAPFPENFWTFYLEIALFGAFWGVFKVYISIFACQFCDAKGDLLYGLMTKDISYNRPYASYM